MNVEKKYLHEMNIAYFHDKKDLPYAYGASNQSERCIEYPWILDKLWKKTGRLLDAGSTLNWEEVLTHPVLQDWKTHIITLAPEERNYNHLGVGYLYEDLTNLPIRDETYDTIACISTLEHIGMDNSSYGGVQEHNLDAWKQAYKEICRVLKKKSYLYITVPYGKYEDAGWYQQFDSHMLDTMAILGDGSLMDVEIFATQGIGWQRSNEPDTANVSYEKANGRAGAVACITVYKV